MQDRYAGDIGDFIKLAILRRLSAGRRLGILWWLYPDESHNSDGKHVSYLDRPLLWRDRDPELFDSLRNLVNRGERSVSGLEALGLLNGATFFSEVIPSQGRPIQRRSDRRDWFDRAAAAVDQCDLVFLDPDNGLETSRFDTGNAKAGKSVALTELAALRRPGRTLIVYHHQTRMAGGHDFELQHWGRRLRALGFTVDAFRASAHSARAFFVLDADQSLRELCAQFTTHWGGKLSWYPNLD